MPDQDSETTTQVRTDGTNAPEEELFEAIAKKDFARVKRIVCDEPGLNLNCVDKDELSPLQHACHIGDVELARLLINNGADVNFTHRKDAYTALMFAAISSKADIVRLLLERGVDTSAENCVNRTAAQMAAFVGQSKIVSIINNWISYENSIEPYARVRELEEQPRIPTKPLGHLLHSLVVLPSFHPIKFTLYIKDNLDLVKYSTQFIYVLDDLCSKSIRSPASDETLSMKYHYLSQILKYCQKACTNSNKPGGPSIEDAFDAEACQKALGTAIRRMIKRPNPENIQPITLQLDKFITECLFKYPYTQLAIYKTTTFALSKREPGDMNAYSVLTQSLNGPRMFGQAAEACSICLETNKNKQCSKCKSVYYCGQACQLVDWFQHKRVCTSPE